MSLNKSSNKGFTLIELVIVITILGILAAVAVPRIRSFVSEAKNASEIAVVGSIRSALAIYRIYNEMADLSPNYPVVLDTASNGAASDANPLFGNVLESSGRVTTGWTKTGAAAYTGPDSGTYTYDNSTGIFED